MTGKFFRIDVVVVHANLRHEMVDLLHGSKSHAALRNAKIGSKIE